MVKVIVPKESYGMAKGIVIGASAVALLGGGFFYGYVANNIPGRGQPGNQNNISAAVNYQPLPASETFRQYAANDRALNDEFRRSARPERRLVPLPRGVVETDGTATPMGFALDANNDGVPEYNLEIDCSGSGGCWGEMRGLVNGEFRVLLDDTADFLSPESVSGYRNIFNVEKKYLPTGGFTEQVIRYSWDGQRYQEAGRFLPPENIRAVSESLTSLSGMSPESGRETMLELQKILGTHYTMMAFADFTSGGMIPPDMYMDYLREYSRETGRDFLNAYADNPQAFEQALFSDILANGFIDQADYRSYILVGARAAARSISRDLKQDPYSRHVERINKIEQGSGWINAFRSRAGRDPTPFEFRDLYMQGAAGAISEDQLRTQSPTYVNEQRSGSITGSTVTREIDPLDMPGDPRYVSPRSVQQPRADFNQNLQRAQDDAKRAAGQAIQGAGKAIDDILKNLPQQPQRGRGGGN